VEVGGHGGAVVGLGVGLACLAPPTGAGSVEVSRAAAIRSAGGSTARVSAGSDAQSATTTGAELAASAYWASGSLRPARAETPSPGLPRPLASPSQRNLPGWAGQLTRT